MLANIRLVAILAFGLFVQLKLGRARALNIRARAKSGLGPIQELRARTLQKARKTSRVGLGSGSGRARAQARSSPSWECTLKGIGPD